MLCCVVLCDDMVWRKQCPLDRSLPPSPGCVNLPEHYVIPVIASSQQIPCLFLFFLLTHTNLISSIQAYPHSIHPALTSNASLPPWLLFTHHFPCRSFSSAARISLHPRISHDSLHSPTSPDSFHPPRTSPYSLYGRTLP